MSYTYFTCKTIIKYFKNPWIINYKKCEYLKKPGIKVLIGLGIVSVIPNVSAQSELTSVNTNKTSDQDTEKHEPDDNDGWERLKAMYRVDEFGDVSREIKAVTQTTCIACICGALYGGVQSSRIAFRDFMERNQATLFENQHDGKKRLQNHVTVHFGKGAFRWAVKLSAFNAGFMLFLTSLHVYRGGQVRVVDYMISGFLVGSILKFRVGPRAALVGGAVGGALGAFCGLTTKGMFYIFGSSLDEVIAFQYELDQRRENLFKENLSKVNEKHLDNKTLNLLKLHDREQKVTKEV